jgi:hypothetical protein
MTLLRRFPLPPSRSVALARSLDLFLVLRLGRFRRVSTPQQLRTKSLCLGAGALHSHALLAGHAGLQAGHSAGHRPAIVQVTCMATRTHSCKLAIRVPHPTHDTFPATKAKIKVCACNNTIVSTLLLAR